jgi:hypothetical protein
MKARLAIVATMCVAAVLNACGDPTNLRASGYTSVDTLSVFALTGTPPSYPSAISILAGQPVRVDGFGAFDVAFDIDPNGRAIMYPVKLVIASPGAARPVGLQKLAALFDSVTEAPSSGYNTETSVAVAPGETVVIQSAHNGSQDICQFALSPYIYAKIAVDSVNLATRTLYLRMGVDPNCGFRSFAEGIPTS